MLLASERDMDWSRRDTVSVFAWGSGVQPARDRRMMGLAPTAAVPKNLVIGQAQQDAFGDPAKERFRLPIPPITVGSLTKMVVLRKKIADGTALPGELADFERTSAARQAALDQAMTAGAEALVKYRDEKLYVSGLWNALYQVAKAVREHGLFSAKDFHPDNCIYIGGGLKRAQACRRLPGIRPPDIQHPGQPGLPELLHAGAAIPACRKCQQGDRYHVPPWLVPFILDKEGAHPAAAQAARSKAAPPSSIFRSTGAGAGSSPATRSRSTSVPAPAAARARRSVTTLSATPTSKATTRSAARAP